MPLTVSRLIELLILVPSLTADEETFLNVSTAKSFKSENLPLTVSRLIELLILVPSLTADEEIFSKAFIQCEPNSENLFLIFSIFIKFLSLCPNLDAEIIILEKSFSIYSLKLYICFFVALTTSSKFILSFNFLSLDKVSFTPSVNFLLSKLIETVRSSITLLIYC